MPAKKQVAPLTEEEHYKLVDAKLAALMNAIPEPPARKHKSPSSSSSEDEKPAPRKASAWSQRVSAFYQTKKAKDPSYTYKEAMIAMKGK